MKKFFILFLSILINLNWLFSQGVLIPTNPTQSDFLKAYKYMLKSSDENFRSISTSTDTILFPTYSEFSVYRVIDGAKQGSFVLPGQISAEYSSVSSSAYTAYDWKQSKHTALNFKKDSNRVWIFKSKLIQNGGTVSWEANYFANMFDTYLFNDMYKYCDEDVLTANPILPAVRLIIIPSFSKKGEDNKFFIDQIFANTPGLVQRFQEFLQSGGTIYAEGNAVYFIEKLGYLNSGSVNFEDLTMPDASNHADISLEDNENSLAFAASSNNNKLYIKELPQVSSSAIQVVLKSIQGQKPVLFTLEGSHADGGKIICNTGLPTVGGIAEIGKGSRQLQWTLDALLYTFSSSIDYTRSVFNILPSWVSASRNTVPYDRIDTFEVQILLRNLSSSAISNISIEENITPFFKFLDLKTSGINATLLDNILTFNGLALNPFSEQIITYRLVTPSPDDSVHAKIDQYLIKATTLLAASEGKLSYETPNGKSIITQKTNYANIMFAADIAADTDLNWKNFLGLDFQPFKIFMILENKSRTAAEEAKYVQYIPKDVPFYRTDNAINIPILKTPGGQFIDVLKGSNDKNNPDFDMDSDGKPDVWLDTASIYPKGYTITEEEVYWLNPWEHLRSGMSYYEDLDHDGLKAQDLNKDGIVDIEEPGDKMRVWKITWNMEEIPGYMSYEPYCSFEMWVDPPDLVAMAQGLGYVYNQIPELMPGSFYPYSPDIENANLTDTSWTRWMERDANGDVYWKQFIRQTVDNYEGYTFIDTAAIHYQLKPTDICKGSAPWPHNEFIAVLSLGGEEIDMYSPKPENSLYSKVKYKTIFGEEKETPVRTTYTYYAPLPNPLQFEYLTNNYLITDIQSGDTLKFLPKRGKVNLTFQMDASTEYSYYWIRNAGHDVMYNDPSLAIEGVDGLGDGVFGYMIYDLPKGIGGYKITLPQDESGEFILDSIVKVNGLPFEKWLDNPNTANEVKVFEDQFQYHVYIPQLLIPPALDDDNFDEVDDWIDDRGDRYCSSTGFLHDAFMLGDGHAYKDFPVGTFTDDIYGVVDSGWYAGTDNTYGDDKFENMGSTAITIHAVYEGKGREGLVEISKGGWLTVEEIFGGSPWVLFSHTLSGYAEGVEYVLKSESNPSVAKFGTDTMYIKHTLTDVDEPHKFDWNFDPYYLSYGYGNAAFTSYAGGKDPCSLVEPNQTLSTIMDADYSHRSLTLIPNADASNPTLTAFPKTVEGSFIEVKLEVSNGTGLFWKEFEITPVFGTELKATQVAMQYVAYPRPLVPGDDIGAFKAGWRFNQPEGEVLCKVGNKLPVLQPGRRAYFIYLIQVDESLENGVYPVSFTTKGQQYTYKNELKSQIDYEVPPIKFSISERTITGSIEEFQNIVIGEGKLQNIISRLTENFKGNQMAKASNMDVNHLDFPKLTQSLNTQYDSAARTETIDLSSIKRFPSKDTATLYILEQGVVSNFDGSQTQTQISLNQTLNYLYSDKSLDTSSQALFVTQIGPKIFVEKYLDKVNGKAYSDFDSTSISAINEVLLECKFEVSNLGNDISQNTTLNIDKGPNYIPVSDSLPTFCRILGNDVVANLGSLVPGENTSFTVLYKPIENIQETENLEKDAYDVVSQANISYIATTNNSSYAYSDTIPIVFMFFDFKTDTMSVSEPWVVYGQNFNVKATIQNYGLSARDVNVKVYAQLQDKQIDLSNQFIGEFLHGQKNELDLNCAFPDTLLAGIEGQTVKLFAKVDGTNQFGEIFEQNNEKSAFINLYNAYMVEELKISPNPANLYTTINYNIVGKVDKAVLKIFNLESRTMMIREDLPVGLGDQVYELKTTSLPNGPYLYNLSFEGDNQKKRVFEGKIIVAKSSE